MLIGATDALPLDLPMKREKCVDRDRQDALVFHALEGGEATDRQLELLQSLSALTHDLGCPPSLSVFAREVGLDRRAAFELVKALRKKGLLMQPAYRCAPIQLSNNGKLVLETVFSEEVRE